MRTSLKVGTVILLGSVIVGCGPHLNHDTRDQLTADMDPSHPRNVRNDAALELGKLGGAQSEAVLEKYLTDSDPEVQIKVIHALSVEMYDFKAAPQIVPLIHSDNPEVAKKAITALEHLEYRAAVPDLTQVRDNGQNPEVIKAANHALVYFERH